MRKIIKTFRNLIITIFFSKINYLILFVTNKCNSKCKICFNWENIENSEEIVDLKISEIYKIAKNFKYLQYLTISGGEPFIRNDLWKIIHIFIVTTKVNIITIPTNGTLPKSIKKQLSWLSSKHPDVLFNINLSIDAIGKYHDEIRGFKNNFSLVQNSYNEILELKKKNSNINLQTTTVISKYNEEIALETIKWINMNMKIDNSTIALVRGNTKDKNTKNIQFKNYFNLAKYAKSEILDFKSKKNKNIIQNLLRMVKAFAWDIIINTVKKEKQIIECTSGKNMIVIDSQTNVFPCEILSEKFGNLRECDYNLQQILNKKNTKNALKKIKNEKCYCTFECAIQNSIVNNPKTYPFLISSFLKRLLV